MSPSRAGWLGLWAAAALLACNSEYGLDPAPRMGAEGDDRPEVGAPATPQASKRRMLVRSPMGGPPGDLLVDGDFEFSVTVGGHGLQTGWRAFAGVNETALRSETGGLCRSGLRCVAMGSGMLMLGQGTAADDLPMVASLWSKPPAGRDCGAVGASLFVCDDLNDSAELLPDSSEPGADGWCHYRRLFPRRDAAMCMFLDANVPPGDVVLVDAASLVPANGTVPLSGAPPLGSASGRQPLSGVRKQRAAAVVEIIRRTRRFDRGPATPPLGP
jgi:hypothetical protein